MRIPAKPTDEFFSRKKYLTRSVLIPVLLLVVVLASLLTTGEQNNDGGSNKQIATMADGDLLSWGGSYNCSDIPAVQQLFGLPPCTVPRPNNPAVGVVCEKPQLTVAIMIDRSDSVIRDTGGATPGIFKDSVELLLDNLYSRFRPNNGELDFLIYAFGTKSVIQNARDNNGNYITDASTPQALADLKQSIERIHFRNGEVYANKNLKPNGFQSRTQSPYDLERAYDAGSENAPGVYGLTNWHDALVQVLRAQSGPYNNPQPGRKIDLAVMFTDGFPDKANDKDWNWTPGQFEGNDTIGYSWGEFASPESVAQQYLSRYDGTDDLYRPGLKHRVRGDTQDVVDVLRSGNGAGRSSFGGGFFAPRPPVSVRGIMIRPNATQEVRDEARWWGDQVFSKGNYYFATNFDEGLQNEITDMAQDVLEETGCDNLINPVTPGLSLQLTQNGQPLEVADGIQVVRPMEGESPLTIRVDITNNGESALKNFKLCYLPTKDLLEATSADAKTELFSKCPVLKVGPESDELYLEQGDTTNGLTPGISLPIEAELGAPVADMSVVVVGIPVASEEELEQYTNATGLNFAYAVQNVRVIPGRRALPA